MRLDGINIDQLWGSALAAVPLAIGVWAMCRFGRFRPATRHVLWVIVLVSLLTPIAAGVLGLPRLPIERWLRVTASTSGEALSSPETGVGAPGIGSNAELAGDSFPWLVDRAGWEMTPTNPAGGPTLRSLVADAERGSGSDRSAFEARAATTPESSGVGGAAIDTSARTDGPRERTTGTGRKPGGSFAAEELRRWSAAMLGLRDAIASIPPVPAGVWLAGILAAVVWRVMRIGLFVRAMGAGTPASAATRALVAEVAAEVGLARAPLTLMLDRRVSPLVWCGLRPRLVLPEGLWDELDSAGRRAVLMHELAHLKRRDHYVVWLSQAVSLVYWWHPVVWWVCRRIDEEADFACDAWVTSLRPAGRRVYAETLVVAQSYVSGLGMSRAPGLAMASHSARQLSRRLTMVMTQRTSPGLSTMGVIVAAGVAAAGMFVTPTLARPENETNEVASCPPVQPTAVAPQVEPVLPTPTISLITAPIMVLDVVPPVAALVAPAPLEFIVSTPMEPTSFETHMMGATQPDNTDLRELLRRIEQLEKALHELRTRAAPQANEV
ncbi:MAG: M56 family metallopeptidase, partial [Planctomycetes bacterium]|nr:M56 family metallopeptidase [Planctomycetota bacterium]